MRSRSIQSPARARSTKSIPWQSLILAFAWACLVAAAVLAVAAVAGAQEVTSSPVALPEDDCDFGRPYADEESDEESDDSGSLRVQPQPVALADVEWAGLLWGTAEGYLPAHLLSADVDLRITGFVARARVTQRFSNPGQEWMEGVYVFPLPEDAAVDQLRLVVGERVLEGQIQEKEEARRTYEAAKAEGFKASLVEQHRPNVFTTRVANVGPGEEVEVVIELQQPVRYDAGELSLRFPTVVNPRFFPGLPEPGEAPSVAPLDPALATLGRPLPDGPTGPNAPSARRPAPPAPEGGLAYASYAGRQLARSAEEALERSVEEYAGLVGRTGPALDPPGQRAARQATVSLSASAGGHGRPGNGTADADPLNPVRFAVTLDAGFPLDYLDCPYHRVEVEVLDESRFRIVLAGGAADADRDFELVWAPVAGREPGTALFTEEHEGDTYSLLMVLPPQEGSAAWQPLDREMVFIVDVSGSMHGASMEQAKAALDVALAGLRESDSFNVIAFSDETQPLFPDSLAATPATVAKARRWVAGLEADGGTQMLPALAAALETPPGYGGRGRRTVKQVVFLTDGAVGNEEELFSFIARHLGEARLFTVGIGAAPNGHFMQRAAEEGRGTYTFIGDPREVAFKVEKLARKLEGPILTDVEVRWPEAAAEVWPQRLPDLYAGEPLVVTARIPGGAWRDGAAAAAVQVEVSGRRGGVLWSQDLEVAPFGGTERRSGAAADDPAVRRAAADPGAGVRQLWAKRKIASLLATLASGAEPGEVRSAVLETALHHHLVSPYTSLVAVDVTPSRPGGEGLQGRNVPGAVPAGWTPPGLLPVGGTGWPLHLAAGLSLLLAALLLMGGTSRSGRRWLARVGRRRLLGGAAEGAG